MRTAVEAWIGGTDVKRTTQVSIRYTDKVLGSIWWDSKFGDLIDDGKLFDSFDNFFTERCPGVLPATKPSVKAPSRTEKTNHSPWVPNWGMEFSLHGISGFSWEMGPQTVKCQIPSVHNIDSLTNNTMFHCITSTLLVLYLLSHMACSILVT